jgi:rare lipoprotein A
MLQACAAPQNNTEALDGPPPQAVDVASIADATPRIEPKSRRGNPKTYRVFGKTYHTLESSAGYSEQGVSSWYGSKFHGRLTSSGEPYDMYGMTAAHRSLPLPTYARVSNLRNGRSVVVKINDRGPFHPNRIIDLSYSAALKLDIVRDGTGLVQVTAIDPRRKEPAPAAKRLAEPHLFLQVGAFKNPDNAERLQAKLSALVEYPVRVYNKMNETPIYRVQIGPLNSVEQADEASLQLEKLGFQEMHLQVE